MFVALKLQLQHKSYNATQYSCTALFITIYDIPEDVG